MITTMQCSITDCPAPVRAHGLCQKHYMRQRRHGDPNVTKKRGPVPAISEAGPYARSDIIVDRSPRTLARWVRAVRINGYLIELTGQDCLPDATGSARRLSGSLSVAKLLDLLETRLAIELARRA